MSRQFPTAVRRWQTRIKRWGLACLVAVLVVTFPAMRARHAPASATQLPRPLAGLEKLIQADPEAPADGEAPADAEAEAPDLDLNLPPEFNNFLQSTTPEDIVRAPIRLDGRRLFQIAAPAVGDGDDPGVDSPIEERIQEIEARLRDFATEDFDPDSLNVAWAWTNNQPVLYATANTEQGAINQELLTVTSLDAQKSWYTSELLGAQNLEQNLEQVADEWADILEEALVQFKAERESDFLATQGQIAGGLLITMIVLTMALMGAQEKQAAKRRRLSDDLDTIQQELAAIGQSEPSEDRQAETQALLQRESRLRQQISISALKRRLIQLGYFAVWFGGILGILGLFPYTRWLRPYIIQALQIPGELFLVALVTYLLIQMDDIFIDRLFHFLQHSPRFLLQNTQRRMLRFSTFSSVTKSITGFLIASAGFVTGLSVLGVNIAPLIAGAGIVGLAISFAAQNLIRDIINGFLILFEDQYGVGDVVILGDVGGFVENMGLRITQLRNEEGRLITVPNGTITVVQNLTKEWSRVDLAIDVAHTSDIDEAIALIKEVAEQMATDLVWRELILEPPLMLGVDKLDHVGATVRLWIKTQPLKQWDVAREYRRRLKIAFDQANIQIGVPQQAIRFGTALNLDQPSIRTANPQPLDQPTPTVDAGETDSGKTG
ncbi:MAG: mechanosensitive ion channel family protein [Synechococcales bacterium]|nr:mechanosensitive ion channel family protein [Synechococcales bacterium]